MQNLLGERRGGLLGNDNSPFDLLFDHSIMVSVDKIAIKDA